MLKAFPPPNSHLYTLPHTVFTQHIKMHWKQQAIYAAIIVGCLIFIGILVASIHHKTPNSDLDIAIDEHFRNHHERLPKIPKSQRKRREGEGW